MATKPTDEQINDVLNRCSEMEDEGNNPFFGMTYGKGVKAAIEWMTDDGKDPLME